jgi:hypothetical protein
LLPVFVLELAFADSRLSLLLTKKEKGHKSGTKLFVEASLLQLT